MNNAANNITVTDLENLFGELSDYRPEAEITQADEGMWAETRSIVCELLSDFLDEEDPEEASSLMQEARRHERIWGDTPICDYVASL